MFNLENTLFFVKSPTDFSKLNNPAKEHISTPSECTLYADWFDINKVS